MRPAPLPERDPRLEAIFRPATVAVVGASAREGTIGQAIFRNILHGGFTGVVHPVNTKARAVLGVRAFPSISDVPGAIDLAVIAVPATAVAAVADECGRKGVRGLVVITAGFRETGAEGAAREAELLRIVRGHAMRMVGPNCMGVLNTDPAVRLNATFAPAAVLPGRTAIMTQSGALGIAILEHAYELGLGVSRFASMGNKTDVSGNDLLLAWEDDPGVDQILLYLESFGNPRNFVRIARRVGGKKPVLVVKSGRSAGGARAARSHTGALAESDRAVEALFDECRVIRAATLEELFDHALALGFQPTPRGTRVAIVTNSGGPAIMATDALDAAGLSLATLSEVTKAAIRAVAAPEASVENPVDLIASGSPAAFEASLDALLADPGVDLGLVIFTPPLVTNDLDVAHAVLRAHGRRPEKPVAAVFLGRSAGAPACRALTEGRIPVYAFPESAVRALGSLARLAELRGRAEGAHPRLSVDAERARSILAAARAARREWLTQAEALDLLAAYGLPVTPHAFATTSAEAGAAAQRLGFPVVLKAEAAGLVHKSDVGGVKLGLGTPAEVVATFEAMRTLLPRFAGALVMAQVAGGREVLLGATQDPRFGPLVAFGLGGVYAEVLQDVVLRLAPLTDEGARRAVRAIRAWPVLAGARGYTADVTAVEDALLRVSRLAADFPEIAELDVNPLLALEKGAAVVDARVRLTTA